VGIVVVEIVVEKLGRIERVVGRAGSVGFWVGAGGVGCDDTDEALGLVVGGIFIV